MPRLPRIQLAGILYYATQQGTRDRALFQDEQDQQTYLDLLFQYKDKHEFKLFGYSLISEKIHLIIEPYGDTNISEIMRDLTSRYSKYYNSRYGSTGPLFKGRFVTTCVEKETLLMQLIHFVSSLGGVNASIYSSSRFLFLGAQADLATRFKNSMKVELQEIFAFAANSGMSGANHLAVPLVNEALEGWMKRLKKPVVGSEAFIRRIESEIKEAAKPRVEKNYSNVSDGTAPVAASSSRKYFLVPTLIAACACFIILIPAGYFMHSYFSNPKIAKQVVAVPAKPVQEQKQVEVQISNKTLTASVIVLDGTDWNVKLIPAGNKDKSQIQFDRISFARDQVSSKNMAAKGFQPTFYTVTTNPDGTIVWETMQTGPRGETVAWRGEWIDGQMRGVISQQKETGETRVFQFVGSR